MSEFGSVRQNEDVARGGSYLVDALKLRPKSTLPVPSFSEEVRLTFDLETRCLDFTNDREACEKKIQEMYKKWGALGRVLEVPIADPLKPKTPNFEILKSYLVDD